MNMEYIDDRPLSDSQSYVLGLIVSNLPVDSEHKMYLVDVAAALMVPLNVAGLSVASLVRKGMLDRDLEPGHGGERRLWIDGAMELMDIN